MSFERYKRVEYAVTLAALLVVFLGLSLLLSALFHQSFLFTFVLMCGLFVLICVSVALGFRIANRLYTTGDDAS